MDVYTLLRTPRRYDTEQLNNKSFEVRNAILSLRGHEFESRVDQHFDLHGYFFMEQLLSFMDNNFLIVDKKLALYFIEPRPNWQKVSLYTSDYSFGDIQVVLSLGTQINGEIYTYEDVELRRIFPNEFPQDTVRKSGSLHAEHLGRYAELLTYFQYPKAPLNSHFEELTCYEKYGKKICEVAVDRYSRNEENYFMSSKQDSHVDRRRVFCIFILCFTEDELDRVVNSF